MSMCDIDDVVKMLEKMDKRQKQVEQKVIKMLQEQEKLLKEIKKNNML